MTDVLIPEPGKTAITGQWLTGQILTGQTLAGDTWTDQPLALDGGSGQVYVGAIVIPTQTGVLELPQESANLIITVVRDDIVAVDITGMLDLPREPTTTLINERNLTLVVDDSRTLDLAGDAATLYVESNAILTTTDRLLELDGGAAKLTIEVLFRITVDAALGLDGVEQVRINPALIPFACTPLDLDPVVCLTQGDLTILNTFESGERVLLGSAVRWLKPLGSADFALAESIPVDLDAAPSDSEVLDLVPVGCDER